MFLVIAIVFAKAYVSLGRFQMESKPQTKSRAKKRKKVLDGQPGSGIQITLLGKAA
jgi:hypothetical protein